MIRSLSHLVCLLLMLAFAGSGSLPLAAQDGGFEQIKLTESQVKGYIGANAALQKLLEKIEKAGEKPDPKLVEALEALAKKHGFASFEELDAVGATVSFMLSGFDLESGDFSEPKDAMQAEVASLKEDKSIPEKERNELIKELQDSLKTTPKVAHKENIAVVKKYLKQLEKTLN